MKGAAGQIGREPVVVMQHVPCRTDVHGVFTLPGVATKQAGQHIEGQHGSQHPAGRRQADAATDQGEEIRHLDQAGSSSALLKGASCISDEL